MEKEDINLIRRIEEFVEKLIFASRWILAPFYIGLVLALVLLAFKFMQEFVHFSAGIVGMSETDTLLGILGLIDKTLLGNLLILVIFSGYENFVSLIGVAQGSPDRPRWMGDVDFAGALLHRLGTGPGSAGL